MVVSSFLRKEGSSLSLWQELNTSILSPTLPHSITGWRDWFCSSLSYSFNSLCWLSHSKTSEPTSLNIAIEHSSKPYLTYPPRFRYEVEWIFFEKSTEDQVEQEREKNEIYCKRETGFRFLFGWVMKEVIAGHEEEKSEKKKVEIIRVALKKLRILRHEKRQMNRLWSFARLKRHSDDLMWQAAFFYTLLSVMRLPSYLSVKVFHIILFWRCLPHKKTHPLSSEDIQDRRTTNVPLNPFPHPLSVRRLRDRKDLKGIKDRRDDERKGRKNFSSNIGNSVISSQHFSVEGKKDINLSVDFSSEFLVIQWKELTDWLCIGVFLSLQTDRWSLTSFPFFLFLFRFHYSVVCFFFTLFILILPSFSVIFLSILVRVFLPCRWKQGGWRRQRGIYYPLWQKILEEKAGKARKAITIINNRSRIPFDDES